MAIKSKYVRVLSSQLNSKLTEHITQYRFDISEDDLIYLSLSNSERVLREKFLTQVKEAFLKAPDLKGVVHGVRKIRLGKEGSRSRYFPSMKNAWGGMSVISLAVESRPEARYALELERNPNIRAFRTQAIKFEMPGHRQAIFPDFLILDEGGYLHIREVKQDVSQLADEAVGKFKQTKLILARWGVSFSVVDVSELPHEKKYENLLWLYSKINLYPNEAQVEALMQSQFTSGTLRQLMERARAAELDESFIHYLLFTDELKVNWMKTIDHNSMVSK